MKCPVCGKPAVIQDDIMCSGCNRRVLSCTCVKHPKKKKREMGTEAFDSWGIMAKTLKSQQVKYILIDFALLLSAIAVIVLLAWWRG